MTKIEWAQRAYWVALAAFKRGETITYGELAKVIGYPHALHHSHFGDILAIVFLEDPNVAKVIVRKDTGKPGKGMSMFSERVGVSL